jgi:hypothetical protein
MYQSINSLFRRLKKMEQETEAEEKGWGGAHVSINQLSVLQVEKDRWSKRWRRRRRGGAEHMFQSINSLFCWLKKIDGARDGGGGEGAGWSTCINQSTLCSAG